MGSRAAPSESIGARGPVRVRSRRAGPSTPPPPPTRATKGRRAAMLTRVRPSTSQGLAHLVLYTYTYVRATRHQPPACVVRMGYAFQLRACRTYTYHVPWHHRRAGSASASASGTSGAARAVRASAAVPTRLARTVRRGKARARRSSCSCCRLLRDSRACPGCYFNRVLRVMTLMYERRDTGAVRAEFECKLRGTGSARLSAYV